MRRQITGRAARLACGLGVLAGACATSGEGGRPDARVFGEQCEPGGTFDLDGRAAVLGTLNVHVDASGLVEVDTTAELLVALTAAQNGTEVEVTAEPCAIQIPEIPISGQDLPIVFDVPDQTVASVGTIAGRATLSSASETCADFETDTFTIVLGARLSPETSAALPAADEDGGYSFCAPTADTTCELAIGSNCACDQEGDGQGGATLNAYNVPAVSLDQVYVTLRTSFSLAGKVHSSELIIGEIDASIEQAILGCRLAAGGPCSPEQIGAVKNLNPAITPQPGNPSQFRAVRVGDDASCADIIAAKGELFPR